MRRFFRIAVTCLLLAGVSSFAIAVTVSVQPSMVVADTNGAVIGPVIGFQTNGRPLVLFEDTTQPSNMPRGIILRIEKNTVSTEDDFEVFYSLADCDGTPLLRQAADRSGLAEMTDINYAFGLNASDEIVLFKASGGGSMTSFNSKWRSTTADFGTPQSGCVASTGSEMLVGAVEISDFAANHPPPYGVVFPGLE